MPLYISDYLRDTMHLTDAQHGAYLLLLMCCWSANGVLEDSDQQFAAICRCSLDDWKKHRPILIKFFDVSDGKWTHQRVVRERLKANHNQEVRVLAGSKGGIKTQANRVAKAQQKPTPSPSPSPSPVQSPTPSPKDIAADAAQDGKHTAFIKGWTDNYKEALKVDYRFEGGRDGKAVKLLLGKGIHITDLLEIAKQAWKLQGFNGQRALTIHGFNENFNNIQVEIKNGNNSKTNRGNSPQHPDRNKGTLNEGTSEQYSLEAVCKARGVPDLLRREPPKAT